MAKHRVRALQTLQVADEDEPKYTGMGRRYHLPGKESAVFTCGGKRFDKLIAAGQVIELGPEGEAEVEEVDGDLPSDDPAPDALPLDFPYRAQLVRAGFNTLKSLREVADLTEIPGIGESKAKVISNRINPEPPEDDE